MSPLDSQERAALYRHLAALVTAPLTAEQAAALGHADVDTEALEVAFTQLFLMPGGAPPFVGQWLVERKAEHTASLTATMSQLLEALGLEQTGAQGRLSLDHIGLVLSVVAACLEDPARQQTGEQLERTLLGAWTDRFAKAVHDKAPHPAYATVGQAFVGLGGAC